MDTSTKPLGMGRATPADGGSVIDDAWSAIRTTEHRSRTFACLHTMDGIDAAASFGPEATAFAGAMLGARWGASAFPAQWRLNVDRRPGQTSSRHLTDHATLLVRDGRPLRDGWPGCARIDYRGNPGFESFAVHPADRGVYLSGAARLADLPADVTAVVSLCRVGYAQVPDRVHHVDFRLIDSDDPEANPNLEFVIDDAARTVAALRDHGEIVLLHCVAAQSRTPTVAARYGVLRGVPTDAALAAVCAVLPNAAPKPALVAALRRLDGGGGGSVGSAQSGRMDRMADGHWSAQGPTQ